MLHNIRPELPETQIKKDINDKKVYSIKKSRNYNFFIYKIFKATIKDGKKIRSFTNFCKIITRVKANGIKPFKLFERLYKKLLLGLDYKVQNLGSVKYKLPYVTRGTKALSKASSWLRKSVGSRKGSSYSNRFYNEFLDVASNTGLTMNKKKEFYSNFFKERLFLRFLKFYKPRSRYKSNFLSTFRFRMRARDRADIELRNIVPSSRVRKVLKSKKKKINPKIQKPKKKIQKKNPKKINAKKKNAKKKNAKKNKIFIKGI